VKVTVGIPLYNAKVTVADAIRSVIAQTFQDWEIVVADDGSTDESQALIRTIGDRRVRFVHDGAHSGIASRLNQIAQTAHGDYLARMDADDLMHPDRLCKQVEALEADPTLDVIGTATYTMDAAGVVNGVRGLARADMSPREVVARGLFIHPTVTGRTAWFRSNPYDERFVRAEDHELWCRTASASRFGVVPEPLYFYREGGTGALAKYVQSCRTDRAIFRLYGPAAAGRAWTARHVATSHLKAAAYRLATWTGQEASILARRNQPLTEANRADAERALAVIRATHIPGLDDQGEPRERTGDSLHAERP
jgi:glycosyltransferase involved in cell wall biosynthesis